MTKPVWVIGLGLVCALLGMLFTMMTQDIWSLHTSQISSLQLRDGLRSIQASLDRLTEVMEETRQENTHALAALRKRHGWQR